MKIRFAKIIKTYGIGNFYRMSLKQRVNWIFEKRKNYFHESKVEPLKFKIYDFFLHKLR